MESQLAQLKRPVGSLPPTDRKLDDSYTLNGNNLESLFPGQWLDDAVINTFLRCLCLARPGKCVTLDSAVLQLLPDALGSEESTIDGLYKASRILAATVTGNQGLVFMPFCIRNHWILAVADFQNKVIRVYDSMVSRNGTNEVVPSDLVEEILPCVKGTLKFCIDEDQWAVEHMWLPIKTTYTECGVYICLMALQHAYRPGFKTDEYVTHFYDWNEKWSRYELDVCYWLAGRKMILEVCRRYFKPTPGDTPLMPTLVGLNINHYLAYFVVRAPADTTFARLMPYFGARSRALDQVKSALTWAINSIDSLRSTQHVHRSESIQNNAREVVLTPSGGPFLDEIVDEAVSYAWHDVEALQNLREDLFRVRCLLHDDDNYTQARINERVASYGPEG